ncbi:MAG: CHAT domain-containing protein [Rhodomicrobium sp.]
MSADGHYLAATLRGGDGVRVWEHTGAGRGSWKLIHEDKQYGGQSSFGVAFGPKGALYTVAYDGKLRRYEPGFASKPLVVATKSGTVPYSIAVNSAGDRLAVGYGNSPKIEIYDAASLGWRFDADTKGIANGDFRSLAWSPDGKRLYAGGGYKKLNVNENRYTAVVRVWNRDGEHLKGEIMVPESDIQSLAPCGRAVAMGTSDPALRLINLRRWSPFWRFPVHPDMRNKLRGNFTISGDGMRVRFGLAYGGEEPVVFDLAAKQLVEAWDEEPTFYPADTESLNVTDWEDSFDPKVGGESLKLNIFFQVERARSLAIAPNKESFIIGTDDRLLAYTKNGKLLWQRPAPAIVGGVNVAQNGRVFVAACGDGTLRWYRLSDGQELLALFVHAKDRRWAAWTPGGYYTASLLGGENLIGWQVNLNQEEAASFVPVTKYADRFYRPDVVVRALLDVDSAKAISQADLFAEKKGFEEDIRKPVPLELRILYYSFIPSDNVVTLSFALNSQSNLPIKQIFALVNGHRAKAALNGATGEATVAVPKGRVTITIVAETASSRASASIDLLRETPPPRLAVPRLSEDPLQADRQVKRMAEALVGSRDEAFRSLKHEWQIREPERRPGLDMAPGGGLTQPVETAEDDKLVTADYTAGKAQVTRSPAILLDSPDPEREKVYELLDLGRYEEAEENARALVEPGRPNEDLAYVVYRRGRYDDSEHLYEQLLESELRSRGKKIAYYRGEKIAHYVAWLARIRRAKADVAGAERLYQRSLELAQPFSNFPDPESRLIAFEFAQFYLSQRRYGEAEQLATLALSKDQFRGGYQSEEFSAELAEAEDEQLLGLIAKKQGDWERAHENFHKAFLVRSRHETRRLKTVQSNWLVVGDNPAKGAYDLGQELISAAFELGKKRGNPNGALVAESFLVAQSVLQAPAASALAQMAARFAVGTDDFAVLLRERQDLARVLDETGNEQRRVIADPTDSNDTWVIVGPDEEGLDEQFKRTKEKIAALDDRLKRYPQFFVFATTLAQSVEDVQSILLPEEAFLQFLLLDHESFAWVVTKTSAPKFVKLPLNSKEIAEGVQALRCGLDPAIWFSTPPQPALIQSCLNLLGSPPTPVKGEALPFDIQRSHALYQALFGQVENLIKDKKLIIVPSGPLTSLPFSVLVTEAADAKLTKFEAYRKAAWLGVREPITVLPSVVSLQALRKYAKQSNAPNPFVGFGNPLLVGQRLGGSQKAWTVQHCPPLETASLPLAESEVAQPASLDAVRSGDGGVNVQDIKLLEPLPQTTNELCSVARRLGIPESEIESRVWLGSRATKTNVKELSRQGELETYRIVQFATHGLIAGEVKNLAQAALVLTPPATATDADDGLLTASEVTELKFNADWVVLSACNTAAGGAQNAEALSGLARAFFYAGARAILVSHWHIDTDAAVKLTTGAFAALIANPSIGRAGALQQAMSAMIKNGTDKEVHPSIWAPFSLVGEGGAAR